MTEAKTTNEGTVSRINTAVSESGNRQADVKVLTTAKEVRQKTSEVLSEMDKLKNELIEITGGMEEGTPKGIDNEEKSS